MELHLDPEQSILLRDVLDSAWRDLHCEIADTDNSQFKILLRRRERILRSVLDELHEVPATSS